MEECDSQFLFQFHIYGHFSWIRGIHWFVAFTIFIPSHANHSFADTLFEKTKVCLLCKQREINLIITESSVSNTVHEQKSYTWSFPLLWGHTTFIEIVVWITILKGNYFKLVRIYRLLTWLSISRDIVNQNEKYGKQHVLKLLVIFTFK